MATPLNFDENLINREQLLNLQLNAGSSYVTIQNDISPFRGDIVGSVGIGHTYAIDCHIKFHECAVSASNLSDLNEYKINNTLFILKEDEVGNIIIIKKQNEKEEIVYMDEGHSNNDSIKLICNELTQTIDKYK